MLVSAHEKALEAALAAARAEAVNARTNAVALAEHEGSAWGAILALCAPAGELGPFALRERVERDAEALNRALDVVAYVAARCE